MASERTPRKEIEDQDFLKPIDILALGSDDDPCFGKYHDLIAVECQECGDSEFCAVVKAQGLNEERLNLEAKQRFKDIEEADEEILKKRDKAKELVNKYKEQGLKRLKTILKISQELNLPKDIVKKVYDQID